MKKITSFIDGHKTYITLAIAAVLYSLSFWELVDAKTYEYLMTLDTLLFGAAVRSALKKLS